MNIGIMFPASHSIQIYEISLPYNNTYYHIATATERTPAVSMLLLLWLELKLIFLESMRKISCRIATKYLAWTTWTNSADPDQTAP